MLIKFSQRYYPIVLMLVIIGMVIADAMPPIHAMVPIHAMAQVSVFISDFSPASGRAGTTVSISGGSFKGASSVTFNGVGASFNVMSDQMILATVPSGATTGPITVIAPKGSASSGSSFIVQPDPQDPPVISGFSPPSGSAGTNVTINGKNFMNVTSVTFNGTPGSFNVNSIFSITAIVPPGATTGQIGVNSTAGSGFSPGPFTIIDPAPAIDNISPISGPVGTNVTISGRNLDKVSSVTFNGTSASFQAGSSTIVTATVTPDAQSGPITINTANGSVSSGTSFMVIAAGPSIDNFSPQSGAAGSSVTVVGSGFKGANFLSFNNSSASFSVISDTQISAIVPNDAKSGPIMVRTPAGTAISANKFEVINATPVPMINNFSPMSGTVGTTVMIVGSGFKDTRNVTFNGVSAGFSVASDMIITATVPQNATTGAIMVVGSTGTATSSAIFNIINNPVITSINPNNGPVGTAVTITGMNFFKVSAVSFNGVSGAFTVDSDKSITAIVPADATSGPITVVTSAGNAVSGTPFKVTRVVLPPQILSFSPASGPIGAAVSITGKNFTDVKTVTFNGVNASFMVDSDNLILTSVPFGATTGLISLSSEGGTATSSGSFSVSADPMLGISDFSPKTGTIGSSVQISGKGFTTTTLVAFNGKSSNFTVVSDSSITALVPEGATSGPITISAAVGSTTSTTSFTVVSSSLQFSLTSFVANEGDGKATITVTRNGDASGRTTVAYRTADNTAVNGTDYSATAGRLIFEKGITSQSFTITILDNNLATGDVAVELLLSDPTDGATLSSPSRASLVIHDNEAASAPILQVTQSIDFGKIPLNQTKTVTVDVRNTGTQPLSLSAPFVSDGAAAGFFIASPISSGNLNPGASTSFSIGFKPTALNIDGVNGAITLNSNGGNSVISLFSVAIEEIAPNVNIDNPVGGEMLVAGQPFTIKFTGTDNDAIAGFTLTYSVDGGVNIMGEIARIDGKAREVIWNVPDDLQTSEGQIQIVAFDRSGNQANSVSGIFSVMRPQNNAASLQIVLTFDPPSPNQVAPPSNVRVLAMEVGKQRLAINPARDVNTQTNQSQQSQIIETAQDMPQDMATTSELTGYNIYRAPEPPPDQPLPTPEQIVGDPKNLVGSISADSTSFTNQVSTGTSGNFVYSITSFFGNGQSSNGSQPNGTDLPLIKNPIFSKGTISLDAAGSFIKSGATMFINDNDGFVLRFDDSGTRFTIDKKLKGTSSGLTIKKLLQKGSTVRLTVINPDGKSSVGTMFKR